MPRSVCWQIWHQQRAENQSTVSSHPFSPSIHPLLPAPLPPLTILQQKRHPRYVTEDSRTPPPHLCNECSSFCWHVGQVSCLSFFHYCFFLFLIFFFFFSILLPSRNGFTMAHQNLNYRTEGTLVQPFRREKIRPIGCARDLFLIQVYKQKNKGKKSKMHNSAMLYS